MVKVKYPSIDWRMVEGIDNWLDDKVSEIYKAQPIAQDWARISKVQEELGEAIQCFIGYTGQNPRKGITHDLDDVIAELADTAITAILAIQHFTKSPYSTREIIRDKIIYIHNRAINAS